MYRLNWFTTCVLGLGMTVQAFAQTASTTTPPTASSFEQTSDADEVSTIESTNKPQRFEALKDLRNITLQDLKNNATAAQPDDLKDPLQGLNREIFKFNDAIDRHVARPLAVQYVEKVPTEVRGSYRSFRKNMREPWNAVNQLVQGKPLRAAKTLGRFTLNTVTSLGFADPAQRLGLGMQEETLGNTLGYYGVPSGPYLMLPLLGPSTLRHSLDYVSESYATPINYVYMHNNQEGLAWSLAAVGGIDSRSQYLDMESVLQGDRYGALRDIYLQRKHFEIAEKRGDSAEAISFIDDEEDH